MNGSTVDEQPLAVDDFLKDILPGAVAAVSDPQAVRHLGQRELLTYTLQVLHASAWQDVDTREYDGPAAVATSGAAVDDDRAG